MTPYPSDGGARVEYALAYAAYGWRLIPLHHVIKGRCTCRRNDCQGPGKHPRIADWPTLATAEADTIQGWWSRWPEANIGLATGGGLIDIECEAGHEDNIERLEAELGGLPDTVTWISGGGGIHRLFRTSAPIRNATRIGAQIIGAEDTGIDVRGERGLAVLPPSSHKSGVAYRWGNLTPDEIEPATLPEAWELFLTEAVPKTAADNTAGAIPEGSRNSALARQAGSMRRIGMSESAILAALIETNRERCEPPLPEEEVSAIAKSIARYEPDQAMVAVVEGHWEQDQAHQDDPEPLNTIPNPGPMPEELLRVPGFISEIMDHSLNTAPYPNQVTAFCGALAMQAFLAGRKVRDPGNNRTNIYLLCLAHSSAGKDWPRKVNSRLVHEVGLSQCLGDKFASGEGIQDSLFITPSILFQTDEIDGILQSINKARDARHESIMGTLMTVYSTADSIFPMRRKAGKESAGVIDQPCLVVLGTAIPNHYYEALSERMLTNGFFARMLILESGPRGKGQSPKLDPLPPRVLSAAKWWADYHPGKGNIENWHPIPAIVDQTDEARDLLTEALRRAEAEYNSASAANDAVGTTVWGRVHEHTRKLSLLYAISVSHEAPIIDAKAVSWADEFVMHITRRMLFMTSQHVAETPFHAECLKALRKLRETPGGQISHSMLLKRMKVDAKEFQELITTLEQRGDIEIRTGCTAGRPSRFYRISKSAEGLAGGQET